MKPAAAVRRIERSHRRSCTPRRFREGSGGGAAGGAPGLPSGLRRRSIRSVCRLSAGCGMVKRFSPAASTFGCGAGPVTETTSLSEGAAKQLPPPGAALRRSIRRVPGAICFASDNPPPSTGQASSRRCGPGRRPSLRTRTRNTGRSHRSHRRTGCGVVPSTSDSDTQDRSGA